MRPSATIRIVILCALAAVAAVAATPQRPDFSGTWDIDQQATVDSNFASVTAGSQISIRQDPSAIRITRAYGRGSIKNPPVVLTVSLDGKPSPNPYHGVHREGLTGAITSKARWDADRLVIVTTHTLTDAQRKTSSTSEISETLSLAGPRLTIERVVSPARGPARKELWFKR